MIGEGEGTCDNFRFLRLQRYATGISTVLTTSLSAGAIDPEGVAWALDDRATSLTSAYRIIFCVDASYTVEVESSHASLGVQQVLISFFTSSHEKVNVSPSKRLRRHSLAQPDQPSYALVLISIPY